MGHDGFATICLPLERILEDRNFNIRIFYGDLEQLAVELMTEGQHDPLKVRQSGGQYFVVDGHRRQRAFARSLALRIEQEEGRYMVYEGTRPVREAPGPVHGDYDPKRIRCRLVDPARCESDVFASQIAYNRGKPFTLLERMIFLARLLRQNGASHEQLAAQVGFSPSEIAAAVQLHPADPRLLEHVAEGRLSQKLALRVLRTFSAQEQLGRLEAARACAERQGRCKLSAKDFEWEDEGDDAAEEEDANGAEPVRERLDDLVSRLEGAARFAPNSTAEDRLGTLLVIHNYAMGRVPYDRVEAHLLGRQ
jgi:ParB-like chromosome segregation protein Spo0J